jgi:tubulin-specific chaperone D
VREIFDALESGLTDYTLDERGDVGSWIRMSCIGGLSSLIKVLFSCANNVSNFVEYLPPAKFHGAIAGILKQGVERLDNVRQEAGSKIIDLLRLPLPDIASEDLWSIHGADLMKELFLR